MRRFTRFAGFSEVIAAWPSAAEFAADHGVSAALVAVWKSRGSIPPTYWDRTIAGATRRGIAGISLEGLVELRRQASATEAA